MRRMALLPSLLPRKRGRTWSSWILHRWSWWIKGSVSPLNSITRRMDSKAALGSSIQSEIQAFESKGYELGADPVVTEDPGKKGPAKPPPPPTPVAVVDPAVLAQQGKAYLEDVKARKSKEEAERFEVRQNKRKEELEQKQREMEAEEARKKEEVEQTAKKREEEELRQMEIRLMKEVEEQSILEHRRMMEEQLNEQRKREWDTVLARDRELLMMYRQDTFKEVEQEHQRVEAEKKRKLEMRNLRHKEMAQEIFLQILSLAESVALYRECTESSLPMMEWREWQTLFVKGAILPSPLNNPVISTESQTAEANIQAYQAAALDYFNEQGEWGGAQLAGKNKELGVILDSLHSMADAPPKFEPIPHFADFTLKLVVVGTPYSGKTLVCMKIAADFGITIIEMAKVVAAAIAEAEAEQASNPEAAAAPPPPEAPPASPEEPPAGTEASPTETKPETKSQLGRRIKECKEQGVPVPENVLVKLLALTISGLPLPGEGAAAPASPRKDKKGGGGGGGPPGLQITGFVVDGFPSTEKEAIELEKAITGLDLEFTARHQSDASVLAPPPPVEKVESYVSGLDGIFMMQCPTEEIALKRALGKRVDNKTGVFYHLDYDPPPATDKTGISSRLETVEEADAARIRVVEGMQAWPPLASWMEMFRNHFQVGFEDGGKVKPEDAVGPVNSFISAKKQAIAAAAAAKAAKEADEAATQAFAETERAKAASDAASRQLYLAKLAEVEAAAVLEATPTDPAAKEILKVNASKMAGQKLNDAVKALKEIEAAVEQARNEAAKAQEAAKTAQDAAAGAEASFQAQTTAEAAAEAAKQAAARASQTSQKAGFVLDAASQELASSEKRGSAGRASVAARASVAPPVDKRASKAVPATPRAPATPRPPPPPPPSVDLSTAERLHPMWKEIENRYFASLQELFHDFRLERATGRNLLQEIKANFSVFLKRPDAKQKTFNEFQEKYNRVELPQRNTPKMKPLLKKMVEDLSKQLQTICDTRLKEAQENSKKSLADWISQRTTSCVTLFRTIMQIELNRHLQSCSFLFEYFFKKPSTLVSDMFNPTLDLAQTAVDPPKTFPVPGWITAIATSSPQISQALSRAVFLLDGIINAASNPDLDPKAPPKKDAAPVNPPAAITREHEIIQSRMQILASKACSYVGELQPLLNGTSTRMEDWMNTCYKKECDMVKEVIDLSEEAVEENIPLWYRMNLEGPDLVIDQSQIVVEAPPPLALQPIVDFNQWHFSLLEGFIDILRGRAVTGFLETKDATSALKEALESARSKGKEDATLWGLPHLPATKSSRPLGIFQIWSDYMDQVIVNTPASSDAETRQMIDWRALVMTLADMHFNECISASSLDDVVQICDKLQDASKETDGRLTSDAFVAVPFWFDQAATQGGVDIGSRLKQIACKMLQPPPDPNPEPPAGVTWQRLALYFCRDEALELALSKVFEVLHRSGSGALELKPDGILQALYHLGVDQASEAGCLTWGPEAITELVLNIKTEQSKQAGEEGDGAGAESDGSQSGKLCTRSTVAFRGSNLSDQTNLSLKDFGMEEPVYEATQELSVGGKDAEPIFKEGDADEQAVETINEFLQALGAAAQKEIPSPSAEDAVVRLGSVKELLRSQCATQLCSILVENYGTKRLHVMNTKKEE